MPRPRKVFQNRSVILITTSVEEGIMFPANALVHLLLLKCLAQAQKLHPVKVCHFLFESTHVHMLIVVEDPDDVKGFMERFKTESAHAINRLLGRKKRTLWCEGYDSPVLLSKEYAIKEIAYLYENPAKDGLEDSIDRYPGLSSWGHFRSGKESFGTFLIPRNEIKPLSNGKRLYESDYRREVERLIKGRDEMLFIIDPDAWMKCYGIEDAEEAASINNEIIELIREREIEHRRQRRMEGKKVIGAAKMTLTSVGTPYLPDRSGRRMFCIGEKEDRKSFLAMVKELVNRGREVLLEWRKANYNIPYPLGLYPPSLPKRGNLLTLAW